MQDVSDSRTVGKSPRKRCRNFSPEEIDLLLDLLTEPRIKVVESKCIESAALAVKNKTWDDITADFHEAGGGTDRDKAALKSCWKRLKEHAKKQKLQGNEGQSMDHNMTFKAKKVCELLASSVSGQSPSVQNLDSSPSEDNHDFMILLQEPPILYAPPKPSIQEVKPLVDGGLKPVVDDVPCQEPQFVLKSRVSTPEYDRLAESASVALSESPQKREMSRYRQELLSMAREKHEATMINLRLKRRLLEAQLRQLENP